MSYKPIEGPCKGYITLEEAEAAQWKSAPKGIDVGSRRSHHLVTEPCGVPTPREVDGKVRTCFRALGHYGPHRARYVPAGLHNRYNIAQYAYPIRTYNWSQPERERLVQQEKARALGLRK